MKSNKFVLYRHTSPSGKVYIGITNQPVTHRWNNGKGYFNLKKSPFKSTIIKYGWDNIKHEVLFFNLSEDKAKYLEKIFIKIYKNKGISLNVTDGGDGCYGIVPWNKGIKVPYEQSNKRKGCHLTEEHKQKLSISHKGKNTKGHSWTEEQRRKMSLVKVGQHHSEAAKKKIKENSAKAKKVIEYNSKGDVVATFPSAVEAAKKYGIDISWVAKTCRTKVICLGHFFMYEDDQVPIKEMKPPHYRIGRKTSIKHIVTGEIKEFDSASACARYLGYKSPSSFYKVCEKNRLLKNEWRIA